MTRWQRFLVWLLPKWRPDPTNPYRRYCRYCDQQQSQYGLTYSRYTWWAAVYPIMPRRPECDVVHPEES